VTGSAAGFTRTRERGGQRTRLSISIQSTHDTYRRQDKLTDRIDRQRDGIARGQRERRRRELSSRNGPRSTRPGTAAPPMTRLARPHISSDNSKPGAGQVRLRLHSHGRHGRGCSGRGSFVDQGAAHLLHRDRQHDKRMPSGQARRARRRDGKATSAAVRARCHAADQELLRCYGRDLLEAAGLLGDRGVLGGPAPGPRPRQRPRGR